MFFDHSMDQLNTYGKLLSVIFFLLFSVCPVNSMGFFELSLRHLVLRKAPHGCCSNAEECAVNGNPTGYCPLKFKLCLGLDSSSSCLVLDSTFTLHVRSSGDDKSFTVVEFPQQRFEFSSSAISQNISVQMEVWNEHDNKMLLFIREFAQPFPPKSTRTFSTGQYGTSLMFQLSAHCAPGFVGPGCDVFCTEPLPTEKFVCTPEGIQCLPGWEGPKCTKPVCDLPCEKGGICVAPDTCQCPRGWRGPTCSECIPRAGCLNGVCTDEPGKCSCLPNWTGAECSILIDKCLEKPCKNGGQCTTNGTHGNFFHCECPDEFTGIDCSISIKVCDGLPCGRHGQCIPLTNSYTCACASGYGGKDCRRRIIFKQQQPDDEPPSDSSPIPSLNSSPLDSSPISSQDSPPLYSTPIFSPFNYRTDLVFIFLFIILIYRLIIRKYFILAI